MRMEKLSTLEKVKNVTLFYDQQVVVDLKSQPAVCARLYYKIVCWQGWKIDQHKTKKIQAESKINKWLLTWNHSLLFVLVCTTI